MVKFVALGTWSHQQVDRVCVLSLVLYPANDAVLRFLVLVCLEDGLELVELGLEQLSFVRRPQSQPIAFKILNEIDALMDQVGELDIRVRPVINWFLTQKVRIGPGSFESVLKQTEAIFQDMQTILKVYNRGVQWNTDISKDMTWKP